MQNKIIWLENLRAIACIMVVVLHTAAIYVLKSDGLYWEIGNIFDSFVRICVPIFFMISGFLFFDEKKVKIKNFIRLIIPLCFYSFFAYVFIYLSSAFGFISDANYVFFDAPAFYHLWYFYPLLMIYAISYFIRIRNESISKASLYIFIFIFFFFSNPQLNNIILRVFDIDFKNYFNIYGDFIYYLFFSLLGALIKRVVFGRVEALIFFILYIIFSLFIVFLSSKYHNTEFYSFTGPLVVFSSISFFVYSKFYLNRQLWLSGFLKLIAKYSLGIFCIHAFLLLILEKLFDIKSINPVFGIVFFSVLNLILCVFISYIISRFDKNQYVV